MPRKPKPPRELAARALCRLAGNPENTKFEGKAMWESYLTEADAALEAAGLVLSLATDERIALRRLSAELGVDLPEAAKTALRDWLIGHGYLELEEADNDNGDA